MLKFASDISGLLAAAAKLVDEARSGKAGRRTSHGAQAYDKVSRKPVLKCSMCNGEQVAGFKDIRTGKFEEVTLIRNEKELEAFMRTYGIDEIFKEY